MALLQTKEVSKSFGGLNALTGVSLEVEEGKITALIGPNGAGKTTMFNVITGVDRVTEGQIFFKGQRVDHRRAHDVTHLGIARTFQIIRLFKQMTVLENVMVGRHTRTRAETFQILCRLPSARAEEREAREYALKMLQFVKLEHRASDIAGTLPHGQQRMVEMARALASEPQLLLLDEPAAGLNPQEGETLQRLLKSIQSLGITIFLVEHDMRTVMSISDKVCVLNYGQKIAEGPPEAISKDQAVIKAYLGKEYERA